MSRVVKKTRTSHTILNEIRLRKRSVGTTHVPSVFCMQKLCAELASVISFIALLT